MILAAIMMTMIGASASMPPTGAPSPTSVFEAQAQGFSAAFPAPPEVSGHAPTSDDDSGYWIYAARWGGRSFTIRIDQYPKSIRAPAPNPRTYHLLLQSHAEARSSRLAQVRPVDVGGFAGLEGDFVGQTAGGEHVRVLMVGHRVYQISYAPSVGEIDGERGDSFLESFQIDPRQ